MYRTTFRWKRAAHELTVRTLGILGLAATLSIAVDAIAQPVRKLTLNAYLQGAKISMNDPEGPRTEEAMALLDTCVMQYGPTPEAYALMAKIDSIRAEAIAEESLDKRKAQLGSILRHKLLLDSACANPEVKDGLKKKCKSFSEQVESIRDYWFATYYNKGQEAYKPVEDEYNKQLETAADSVEKITIKADIEKAINAALPMFEAAALVKPEDPRVAIRVGDILSLAERHQDAIPFLEQAVAHTKPSDTAMLISLLSQVAYAYYATNQLPQAVDAYRRSLPLLASVDQIGIIKNISACYATLNEIDSVVAYSAKALSINPNDASSLSMLGGMWFNRIQDLNKGISEARAAKDKTAEDNAKTKLAAATDSAVIYLKRAFVADSTDAGSIERYAIVQVVAGKSADAADGWKRLTALRPAEKRYWVYLGDSYISAQKFKDAIAPYEKAVELDPNDAAVWSSLAELYGSHNMPDKAARARATAEKLSK